MREVVEDISLRRSLIASVSRMWANHEWEEKQERTTNRYIITYRFWDRGPHFFVTDKESGESYYVEAYDSFGIKNYWGAYPYKRKEND